MAGRRAQRVLRGAEDGNAGGAEERGGGGGDEESGSRGRRGGQRNQHLPETIISYSNCKLSFLLKCSCWKKSKLILARCQGNISHFCLV